MSKKIAIVHFNIVEKYPPVINLIRYLSVTIKAAGIVIFTTGSGKLFWHLDLPKVTINRVVLWKDSLSRIMRVWKYGLFNLKTLFQLIRMKPDVIIYYETLSAFAPLFYKKWINSQVPVFVHYHEYMSPEEYSKGMILVRRLHKMEKSFYKKAAWVSHTNEDRMRLFIRDMGDFAPSSIHILPNYPPESWISQARIVKRNNDPRIGFVYVGSLSIQTMHTKEMAMFIANNPDLCYWDIYSNNHDKEVMIFLSELRASNIFFKGAIAYDDLPSKLPMYDIGLILYNAYIPNYAYNAPNKLFEYLACGLNVWFTPNLSGILPFKKDDKPWVKMINIQVPELPELTICKRSEQLNKQPYIAEEVYLIFKEELEKALNKHIC